MEKIRIVVVLTLLCLGAPAGSFAYPIPPQTLWQVAAEAQSIVVAEVDSVDLVEMDEDSWVSAIAHLSVAGTLKGPPQHKMDVPYAANLICPAPPRYAIGETVVAFLDRREDQWRTVALSYGTLYPAADELEDVKTMIKAAVELQRNHRDTKKLNKAKREWSVDAAVRPGTRWHGLYELYAASDPIRSYYDPAERPTIRLSKSHREVLAEAFLSTPKMDATMPMMLQVLQRHKDPKIDEMALGTLEGLLLLEQPPWWTEELLLALLVRFGDPEPEKYLESLGGGRQSDDVKALREFWIEIKHALSIPDVTPLSPELERHLPVGGQTPS